MGPANYRCLSGRLIFGNADRRTTVTRVVYLCLARLPHIVTMNTRAGTHSTDVVTVDFGDPPRIPAFMSYPPSMIAQGVAEDTR